jgi:hypothetical protein
MALVSPGVSITVTDESQYVSNAVGTVPLVIMATAENKTINGALATGTTEANAGVLQVFGSQRDLSTAMGYPVFQQSSAGTPLNGNELNEYGLMAAYSALGLGNQLYAIRADIDLNELQPTSVRPTGTVSSGTYWFDLADTTWGINEWSQATQSFTLETPIIITSSSQTANVTQGTITSEPTPLSSVGQIGNYAVVATTSANRIFYKAGINSGDANHNGLNNTWVLVGTPAWAQSHPIVVGTVTYSNSLPLYANSNVLINSTLVTTPGTTLANLVSAINIANIAGVTADSVNNQLAIYSTGTAVNIALSGNSSTLVTSVGLTPGVYNAPTSQFTTYAGIPPWTNTVSGDINAPSGSVWFKVGSIGSGSNLVVDQYNSITGMWTPQSTPSFSSQNLAIYNLDPSAGGSNIPAGSIYFLNQPPAYGVGNSSYAGYKPFVRAVAGEVSATGNAIASGVFTNPSTFTLTATQPGTSTPISATVQLLGTSATDFVTAVLRANIPYVTASVLNGAITLTHLAGGDITLTQISGQPNIPQQAGFIPQGTANAVQNVYALGSGIVFISGFQALTYTYSFSEPVADPADGTFWYYSDPTTVDIMINTGSAWKGYKVAGTDARGYALGNTDSNGVIVAAVAPTTQSSGSALAAGDLWLNTSDLENWPALSRYNGSTWVAIDNTDQVSQNGILFADARWDNSGTNDPVSGSEISVQTLLTSNYVGLDAPNPALYPRGMLLLNTRRSGYNVKKYVADYFTPSAFNVATWSSTTGYVIGNKVLYGTTLYVATSGTTGSPNTNNIPTGGTGWSPLQVASWVTASGLQNSGAPYAGHYAQRQIIVSAMNAAVEANTQIRESQFNFQLICAPGYPELIPNMVALNNDRANTAFVIGDTPLGLDTSVVDLTNWSNDTNGTGLATNDPYLAVYYPSGLSTDLSGNTIVVPPSHMALRTYLYSDNVSYPWFAPAGTRRGLVNNATDLGYVNYTTGEFVRTGVNQALRDALYQININPITIIPGIGLVVWGQKTRDPNTESMDRVNVSRLVNYIRTIFARSGDAFLFEPNDKLTRDQFAAVLNSALNDLVSKRGIYDYLVVCDTTNNTPDTIANNELYADVAIEPMKDVEFIYIPIRLYNPGTIATLGSA